MKPITSVELFTMMFGIGAFCAGMVPVSWPIATGISLMALSLLMVIVRIGTYVKATQTDTESYRTLFDKLRRYLGE